MLNWERVMKTCLVVDDAYVIRKVARRILEEVGFAVEEAADGGEALKSCLNRAPNVVLLDWNMPAMNGYEFLKKLNQANLPNRPKVIFCTTERGLSNLRGALEEGANGYLVKPFDREAVLNQLKRAQVI